MEKVFNFLNRITAKLIPEETVLINLLYERNQRIMQVARLQKEIRTITRQIDSYQGEYEESRHVS